MNKMYVCILLIMISTLAFAELYVPGHVIFKAKNPITILQTEPQLTTDKAWFNEKITTFRISELHPIGADKIPSAYLSERLYYYAVFDTVFSVKQVVNSMKGENEIAFAEPNFIFHELSGVDTNDDNANSMWGLKNIGMQRVWDELQVYGDPSVVVSVIDSGIDLGNAPYPFNTVNIHPDLLGNVWQDQEGNYGFNYYAVFPPGTSPITNESVFYPHDKHGHGTSVAGVISAINNNEYAVSSVAGGWSGITAGTKIMPIRAGNPIGSYLALYYGLFTSYQYGVRIINLSMGIRESEMSQVGIEGMNMLHEIIVDMHNDAYNFGVRPLVIVAGGNSDCEEVWYPACFDEVLAVGAVDVYDKRGIWSGGASTYHSTIDIVAPGSLSKEDAVIDQVGIYTTFPTDVAQANLYHYTPIVDQRSGTSLAAPHVSGVAALVLSQFPTLTNEQLRGRLVGTSDYIYDKNQAHLGLMGSGRLNAYRALTEQEQPNLVLNGIQVNGITTDVIDIGPARQRLSLNIKNWWSDATNVWGLLSTDDPNVSIRYLESNRIDWGNIQTEETLVNNTIVTIYATGFNRLATFTLTIDSDANAPKVMTFTLKIQTSVEDDYFCVIPSGAGGLEESYLNKNFTVKDVNNDGFDEIFVTSRNGYLFVIHQDGSFVRRQLTGETTCTPAVGDIDSDKVLDIVVGDDNGQVNIFSGSSYTPKFEINTVQEGTHKVTFITLEDINNDGQLDIVAVFEKISADVGANGFSVINMLGRHVYNYNTTYTIQHGVSVDDVNGNGLKDVVFLCQNYNGLVHNQTNLFLDVVEVSEDFTANRIYHNTIGNSLFSAGSSPLIVDLSSDGSKEMIIRYEWSDQGQDNRTNRKVGIQVFNYNPTDHSPICEYPTGNNTVRQLGRNDNIIVGNFSLNPGLEILFTHDKLTLLDANGVVIKESNMLPYELNSYQEYTLALDNSDNDTKYYRLSGVTQYYRMSAHDSSFQEDYAWKYDVYCTSVTDPNDPIGLAFVNTSWSSSGIVMPMKMGQFAMIPLSRDDFIKSDYRKYRYNSRHTGSYNQPLPRIVTEPTEVKHNLYIENHIYFESEMLINPTVRIVVDPNLAIKSNNHVKSAGNRDNGLQIYGTCLKTTPGYWDGLTFKNGSSSDLSDCDIRNAAIGISYDDTGSHFLNNSTISYNDWGLAIYQANPILMKNKISNNDIIGLALHNGASPLMGADASLAGGNSITNNPVGIFSSQSNPILKQGHNDIVNLDMNIQIAYSVDPIPVQQNWWGSDNPDDFDSKFNPRELVVYDPWDSTPNTPYSPQSNPFILAMQLMFEEQYLQAIPYFHQVLADSTVNYDDHASINALLTCYDKTDNLNYYRDFILCQLENELHEKLEQWYKDCLALINRSVGRFMDAISYYEYKLDNSTTLADSCYAIIDLGNTYLESNSKTSGKYAHLVPKSYLEHSQLTKELLNKIYSSSTQPESSPPIENVFLKQNYPNPFNPTTTISFYLPQQSKTQLLVYNLKGQVVNRLRNDVLDKGYHSVVWDGKDHNGRAVASGLYFYQLKTDKSVQIKKCILLK